MINKSLGLVILSITKTIGLITGLKFDGKLVPSIIYITIKPQLRLILKNYEG